MKNSLFFKDDTKVDVFLKEDALVLVKFVNCFANKWLKKSVRFNDRFLIRM